MRDYLDTTCHLKDVVKGSQRGCDLSEEQFQKKCHVREPEDVNMIQELTDEGKLDIILRWKKSVRWSKIEFNNRFVEEVYLFEQLNFRKKLLTQQKLTNYFNFIKQ